MTSLPKRIAQILILLALVSTACTTPDTTPATPTEQAQPTHPEAGAPGTGPDSIRPSDAPPVTPEFPYSGHGETLVLIQTFEDGKLRIVFLDPFGLGFREVILPEGLTPYPILSRSLSTDGTSFVYFSGSIRNRDLTLGVYDLNDESVAIEIPLLSSDYPNNFQELADSMIDSGNIPEDLSYIEPENMAAELQNAFEYGFPNIAWSPSGRYLAFSGQMEGPSSDLYVLDMQTMEVTRLTSGTGMMLGIGWSPDDHWIRHNSTYFVGAGYRATNHVASLDGSQVISFPTYRGLAWGPWLTDDMYLTNESDNGPGTYDLKVMDTRNGSVTTIYQGAFFSYAYDPISNTILIQGYDFIGQDPFAGLYLINATNPYNTTPLSTPGDIRVDYAGLDQFPFIGFPEEGGTVLIRLDGSFEPLSDENLRWSTAPSGSLAAFFPGYGDPGLWIYDVDQDQRTDVYDGGIQWAYWRPDSGAIFYLTDHELHVYNLETGDYMLIYAWPGSPILDTEISWVTLP